MEEPKTFENWYKLSTLGSGGFGIVTLWRNNITNEMVAIKMCRYNQLPQINKKQCIRWKQEVDFLKTMKHANIVAYKSLSTEFVQLLNRYNLSGLPILPMEYCSKGNLRHYLLQSSNMCGLSETDVRYVLNDISSAISYLHGRNIIHRDIKPENVVLQDCIGRPNKVIFKIIDLGYAKDMNTSISFVGTLDYLAPEIFKNDKYTHTVDYWSFGILAYEVISNRHPFLPKLSSVQRFQLISKKTNKHICVYQSHFNNVVYTDTILKPYCISPYLASHLEKWLCLMLRYDSNERGSNDDVLNQLKNILQTKFFKVFCPNSNKFYYYEFKNDQTMEGLQLEIEKDTGIRRNEQLLLGDNFHFNPKEKVTHFQATIGLTDFILLGRHQLMNTVKIEMPMAVRNILRTDFKYQYESNELYEQLKLCAHYVWSEEEKIQLLRKSFQLHYSFTELKFEESIISYAYLHDCTEILLKQLALIDSNVFKNEDSIFKFRKQLLCFKELLEIVNTYTVRIRKLRVSEKILQYYYERLSDFLSTSIRMEDLFPEAIRAIDLLKNKPETCIPVITKAICTCLKYRDYLERHDFALQYFFHASKMLREMTKLESWIICLTRHIKVVSAKLQLSNANIANFDITMKRMLVSTDSSNFFESVNLITNKFFGVLDDVQSTQHIILDKFHECICTVCAVE